MGGFLYAGLSNVIFWRGWAPIFVVGKKGCLRNILGRYATKLVSAQHKINFWSGRLNSIHSHYIMPESRDSGIDVLIHIKNMILGVLVMNPFLQI